MRVRRGQLRLLRVSMLALQASGASWPAAGMESMVGLWTTLNWARMVVGAAGWLCALRALSPSRVGGGVAGLPTPGRNRWMKERITACVTSSSSSGCPRPRLGKVPRERTAPELPCAEFLYTRAARRGVTLSGYPHTNYLGCDSWGPPGRRTCSPVAGCLAAGGPARWAATRPTESTIPRGAGGRCTSRRRPSPCAWMCRSWTPAPSCCPRDETTLDFARPAQGCGSAVPAPPLCSPLVDDGELMEDDRASSRRACVARPAALDGVTGGPQWLEGCFDSRPRR